MNRNSILYLTITEQRNHSLAKIIGPRFADAANPQNDFSLALTQIFNKVISYDYLKSYFKKGVKITNQEIIELVKREKPKYLLWRAHDYQIMESTFQTIRELGCIVLAWFFDDNFRFHNYARLYIPNLDYSITVDPYAVSKYKSLGARCFFSPGVCAGEYYKKLNLNKKYDVSFVGTNLWKREELIEKLGNLRINVATFGEGWNSGKIKFNHMLHIFNTSKINLNFSRVGSEGELQLKGRIFEVAMCGGFILSEYVPEIEQYFVLDREIVCFVSVEEMFDKINYYLMHDKEREIIARNARKRALKKYTWNRTLPKLFEKIEKDIRTNARPNISQDGLDVPKCARLASSSFHYMWASAWLTEKRPDMCKDELELSLKYNPDNFKSRKLSKICRLPKFLQPRMFRIMKKLFDVFRKFRRILKKALIYENQ